MTKFAFIAAGSFVFACITSVVLQHFNFQISFMAWLVAFILYMVLGYKTS